MLINTDRGVITMGDLWDYRLQKAEMVWELASRMIPSEPATTGRWVESNYLIKAQEVLKTAHEVIDAVFKED